MVFGGDIPPAGKPSHRQPRAAIRQRRVSNPPANHRSSGALVKGTSVSEGGPAMSRAKPSNVEPFPVWYGPDLVPVTAPRAAAPTAPIFSILERPSPADARFDARTEPQNHPALPVPPAGPLLRRATQARAGCSAWRRPRRSAPRPDKFLLVVSREKQRCNSGRAQIPSYHANGRS
jgi:hypothetical protein